MTREKLLFQYEIVKKKLLLEPKVWLITGVVGFIGSNFLEHLLKLNQKVVGLDNFSTGFRHNVEVVKACGNEAQWELFGFVEGDIQDYQTCIEEVRDVDYVLHQAAFGSVPRSINNFLATNSVDITGFLKMLEVLKKKKV